MLSSELPDRKIFSNLDPNERFLWLCLRGRWEPDALEQARQQTLLYGFQWGVAQKMVHTNSIGPLLYSILSKYDWVPVQILSDLFRSYLECVTRNAVLLHEAEKLVHALYELKIETIFLKGAALVATCYHNPGLRPMIDLDILVDNERAMQVANILIDAGYTSIRSEVSDQVQMIVKNEIVMQNNATVKSTIEIHQNLFDSTFYQSTLPMDWFWRTAEPSQINQMSINVLGPEAQIIHLCGHLYLHHVKRGFLRYHDLAEVIVHYRERIDWGLVIERGRDFNLLQPLKNLLSIVAEIYPGIIPPEVLEDLQNCSENEMESSIYIQTLKRRESVGKRLFYDLAGLESRRDKVQFFFGNIFPSISYMQNRYQVKSLTLVVFYYPYRWYLGVKSLIRRNPKVPRS